MSRTSNFRRQHDAALVIVGEIQAATAAFGGTPSRAQARAAALLLARLTGLLRIHFAQEDKLLYPKLMASGDDRVAVMARHFVAEMGQIGPAYVDFVERWESPDAIVANGQGFAQEGKALFHVLNDRITRENDELYPLADAMEDDFPPIRAA